MTARKRRKAHGAAALRHDLERRLRIDDGLERILGTKPRPPEADPGRTSYSALVDEVASIVSVDDGLATILTASGHAALVADLPAFLRLDRGLADIFDRAAGTAEAEAEWGRGEATALTPHPGLSGGSTEVSTIDQLISIYAAEGRHRLLLRSGNRHRHLREIVDRLSQLTELLRPPAPDPSDLGWVAAMLERQINRMERVTALLVRALPGTRATHGAVSHGAGFASVPTTEVSPRKQSRRAKKAAKKAKTSGGANRPGEPSAKAVEQYRLAVRALIAGEWVEAQARFHRAANLGHLDAMVNLAMLYAGDGRRSFHLAQLHAEDPRDRAFAARVFVGLALAGNDEAGYFAGELLAFAGSTDEAIAVWQRASKAGNRRAAARLRDVTESNEVADFADPQDPGSKPQEPSVLVDFGFTQLGIHGLLGSTGEVDEAMLADQVTPLIQAVSRELSELVEMSRSQGGSSELVSLAGRLHHQAVQTWRALSDFEGADLRAAEIDPGLADLDGVRWSDGDGRQLSTLWPTDLREAIQRQSEPLNGEPGMWEVTFREVVGADR
nr:hypothetical protein [uncultured Actinoplanes sp.]